MFHISLQKGISNLPIFVELFKMRELQILSSSDILFFQSSDV